MRTNMSFYSCIPTCDRKNECHESQQRKKKYLEPQVLHISQLQDTEYKMLTYIHKIYKYINYIIKSQNEEPKRDCKKEQKELKKNKSDLEMKNTVLKVTKITQKIQ